MLNKVWCSMIILSAGAALYQSLWLGDHTIYSKMMVSLFDSAKTGFEISIGLTGVLSLWLGLMKVAQEAGLTQILARGLTPLFRKLMPDVPSDHPAIGAITMNIAANALGLDNAATPLGIKAMKELQTLNPTPERATDAQILFLVINTSAVTLFPITIFTYRAQMGAANPTDVFIPILIATYCSTLGGLIAVSLRQPLLLFTRTVFCYFAAFTASVLVITLYFASLPAAAMQIQSAILSNAILFSLIVIFIATACIKKINAYNAFLEGAKEGFQTAITIIPYLIAMLAAIALFRSSGLMDSVLSAFRILITSLGVDTRFIEALPTAMMKPFSGSGARAMMVDAMQQSGVDSLPGRLACVVQGSTETTFYVLAVYFGVVGIRHTRHAISCGLIADICGITAAIAITYLFFG